MEKATSSKGDNLELKLKNAITKVYKNGSNERYCGVIYKENKFSIQHQKWCY